MSDTFIPLTPAGLRALQSSTAVVGGEGAAQPSSASATPTAVDPAHAAETCAKPAVTLKRTGNTVTAIHVQCGCGRLIELNCVY